MKILHTGDLHLDSPFCSLGVKDAETRRERQRRVLEKIFEVARAESCSMMLISGDLFDSSFVSAQTAELFCRLVERSGIAVVVSPGNHDPYTEGSFYASSELPENLFVFSSKELQKFIFPELDTEVLGYAFNSSSLDESPLSSSPDIEREASVRLLCAHCELGAAVSRYAPVTDGDIDKFGFDYAALGHIHIHSARVTAGGTPAVYCGFAEGRSFDELGAGGVMIAEIENGECGYRRVFISEYSYEWDSVDVSGVDSEDALIDMVKDFIVSKGYGERTSLRLELTGALEPSVLRDVRSVSGELSKRLAYLEVRNDTLPIPSSEYLEKDLTIRGELYRMLLPMLTSENHAERRKALRALRIGLAAIEGKSLFGGN